MSDKNHKVGEWWSDAKRVEVVTTWLALGKIPLVAACTNVPEGTIRQWRTQPWWKEMEISIQTESDQELDAKLAKRIDKALDVIWERLENGDFMYDPKTSAFVRKPVSVKDANKVMVDMMDKRLLIRKQPKEQQSQEAVGDILKNLAKEFAEMAKKKVKEHGTESKQEELQAGVQELPREAGADRPA
jgi:glutamine synthetase